MEVLIFITFHFYIFFTCFVNFVSQNGQKRALQDLQKAAEKKLQIPNKIEATKQAAISIDLRSNLTQTQTKVTSPIIRRPFPPPPPPPPVTGRPPPPPPPPHQHPNSNSNGNAVHKASALVELYNSMTKQNGKKDQIINGNCSSPIGRNPQSNILGELQNRSAHLLAVCIIFFFLFFFPFLFIRLNSFIMFLQL